MHPIERWFGGSLTPLFRVSLALSLVVMAVLASIDAGLHCPTAPQGIVSFELAGSDAPALLAGWSEAQRRDATFVQGLDYLFLTLYSTALAAGALLLGRRAAGQHPRLASLAAPAAWAHTLAGIADAIENTPMTIALRRGESDPVGATISLVFATAKFALVGVGLLYLIVGLVMTRGSR